MGSNNRGRRPFLSLPSVTSERLEDLLKDKLDICLAAGFIYFGVDVFDTTERLQVFVLEYCRLFELIIVIGSCFVKVLRELQML